jgi:arylsulfatase A-like enzyme
LLPLLVGIITVAVAEAVSAKPDIVYIFTDDMEASLVDVMPTVKSQLAAKGATLTQAYYNDPLCCPSRATMLTGRYAQNTKVVKNSHAQFYEAGNDTRTVALALDAAGYRTGLFGKYLNGYPSPLSSSYVPPGWDRWVANIGGQVYLGQKYAVDGKVVRQPLTSYSTTFVSQQAVDFIKATPKGTPLFAWVSYHAPHLPLVPETRYADTFPTLKAPRSPAFNEADVSDKPAYVRKRGLVSASEIDSRYREMARTLLSVDDGVKAILDALRATGRLANAYIVFSSDNGWMQGEHRLAVGKGPPYDQSLRMPLIVRGPNVVTGAKLGHLVGNVDIGPTFAEWGGTSLAGADGRSFAPVLRAGGPAPGSWRQAYPLFFLDGSSTASWPGYRGLRSLRYAYVEYSTGERELYDTAKDPYELNNIYDSAPDGLKSALASRTAKLASCARAACRSAENQPLP